MDVGDGGDESHADEPLLLKMFSTGLEGADHLAFLADLVGRLQLGDPLLLQLLLLSKVDLIGQPHRLSSFGAAFQVDFALVGLLALQRRRACASGCTSAGYMARTFVSAPRTCCG